VPILHLASCFNAEEHQKWGDTALKITCNVVVPSGWLSAPGALRRNHQWTSAVPPVAYAVDPTLRRHVP
jgi:hypothetical protein